LALALAPLLALALAPLLALALAPLLALALAPLPAKAFVNGSVAKGVGLCVFLCGLFMFTPLYSKNE
jgi:hypothetical protein